MDELNVRLVCTVEKNQNLIQPEKYILIKEEHNLPGSEFSTDRTGTKALLSNENSHLSSSIFLL